MSVPILEHAGELLSRHPVLLCDVWGVVHDGRTAYVEATEALIRHRRAGGTVLLVSNAPMPAEAVARVLGEKAVPRESWDAIVSSGDIALGYIAERGYQRIHHIGPPRRDRDFFARLQGPSAPIEEADAIACTGLVDDRREIVADYQPMLDIALQRRLPFVCANPDLAVHVGPDLLPCAGAIAARYAEMGGEVYWAGKPHPTAYLTALARAAELRDAAVSTADVLAIGDAVRTDLAAAEGAGVAALFIAGGLHHAEVAVDGQISPPRLARLLAPPAPPAVAAMMHLRW